MAARYPAVRGIYQAMALIKSLAGAKGRTNTPSLFFPGGRLIPAPKTR